MVLLRIECPYGCHRYWPAVWYIVMCCLSLNGGRLKTLNYTQHLTLILYSALSCLSYLFLLWQCDSICTYQTHHHTTSRWCACQYSPIVLKQSPTLKSGVEDKSLSVRPQRSLSSFFDACNSMVSLESTNVPPCVDSLFCLH